MFLELKRIAFKKDYTIGKLFVDGKYYCDTLEPSRTAVHPCIPCGVGYVVDFRWSPKFGRYMFGVTGVPCRTGILFHSGNSASDTKGCILLGRNTIVGRLTDSRNTFNAFRLSMSNLMASLAEPILLNVTQ